MKSSLKMLLCGGTNVKASQAFGDSIGGHPTEPTQPTIHGLTVPEAATGKNSSNALFDTHPCSVDTEKREAQMCCENRRSKPTPVDITTTEHSGIRLAALREGEMPLLVSVLKPSGILLEQDAFAKAYFQSLLQKAGLNTKGKTSSNECSGQSPLHSARLDGSGILGFLFSVEGDGVETEMWDTLRKGLEWHRLMRVPRPAASPACPSSRVPPVPDRELQRAITVATFVSAAAKRQHAAEEEEDPFVMEGDDYFLLNDDSVASPSGPRALKGLPWAKPAAGDRCHTHSSAYSLFSHPSGAHSASGVASFHESAFSAYTTMTITSGGVLTTTHAAPDSRRHAAAGAAEAPKQQGAEPTQEAWCWHEVTAKLFSNPALGKGPLVLLVQRDVTHRVAADRAKFQALMAEIPACHHGSLCEVFPHLKAFARPADKVDTTSNPSSDLPRPQLAGVRPVPPPLPQQQQHVIPEAQATQGVSTAAPPASDRAPIPVAPLVVSLQRAFSATPGAAASNEFRFQQPESNSLPLLVPCKPRGSLDSAPLRDGCSLDVGGAAAGNGSGAGLLSNLLDICDANQQAALLQRQQRHEQEVLREQQAQQELELVQQHEQRQRQASVVHEQERPRSCHVSPVVQRWQLWQQSLNRDANGFQAAVSSGSCRPFGAHHHSADYGPAAQQRLRSGAARRALFDPAPLQYRQGLQPALSLPEGLSHMALQEPQVQPQGGRPQGQQQSQPWVQQWSQPRVVLRQAPQAQQHVAAEDPRSLAAAMHPVKPSAVRPISPATVPSILEIALSAAPSPVPQAQGPHSATPARPHERAAAPPNPVPARPQTGMLYGTVVEHPLLNVVVNTAGPQPHQRWCAEPRQGSHSAPLSLLNTGGISSAPVNRPSRGSLGHTATPVQSYVSQPGSPRSVLPPACAPLEEAGGAGPSQAPRQPDVLPVSTRFRLVAKLALSLRGVPDSPQQ